MHYKCEVFRIPPLSGAGAVIGLAVVVALLAASLIVAVVVISNTKKSNGKAVLLIYIRKSSMIALEGPGIVYYCNWYLHVHVCLHV